VLPPVLVQAVDTTLVPQVVAVVVQAGDLTGVAELRVVEDIVGVWDATVVEPPGATAVEVPVVSAAEVCHFDNINVGTQQDPRPQPFFFSN
jgi:hypothetical protein